MSIQTSEQAELERLRLELQIARLEHANDVALIGAQTAALDACKRTMDQGKEAIGMMRSEIERLRGLLPELPPRPPDGAGWNGELPRYGLRWNGPGLPVSVPMDDGYWTPWHLAQAEVAALRKDAAMLDWLDDHAGITVAPDGITIAFERGTFTGFNPTVRGVVEAAMSEQAMQELVEQAQQLDMGYGASPQQAPDTQRPPTPVGWSDTDWLKHLEQWRQNQEIPYVKGPLPERGWD